MGAEGEEAVKYIILQDDLITYLVAQVKEKINNGWIPQGGLVCGPSKQYPSGPGGYWCQAMIKEEKEAVKKWPQS